MKSSAASGLSTPASAELVERIARVQECISESCRRAGREPSEVQLVAVSKTVPATLVEAAAQAGQRVFGENRPEELDRRVKDPRLRDLPLEWHLIGPLQSRKIRLLPTCVALIQSVSRLKTARLISRLGTDNERIFPILLQLNPSLEESKQGLHPNQAASVAEEIAELPGVELQGLMAMAPLAASETELRRYFALTREAMEDLRARLPHLNWRHLSMGMTQDFQIAVEEGATIARIGTAIFGQRLST